MRIRISLLLMVLLGLSFAPQAGAAAGASAAELPANIVGATWELTALQAAGQAAENTTGAGLTITFGADGRASGSGGCNQFSGGYTADLTGKLAFSALAATQRACTAAGVSEREGRYFATLAGVTGYALDGANVLRLTFAQSGQQLVYQRAGSGGATPNLPGTGGGGMAGAGSAGGATLLGGLVLLLLVASRPRIARRGPSGRAIR